jgi:cell wall-associated NlpC family hydrolase
MPTAASYRQRLRAFLRRSACLLLALPALAAAEPKLRDGDIIFHTSTSAQSAAIQAATRSPYSHMGLVLFQDGQPFVFEAVEPVKFTPLAAWTARGKGGRYVVKRWNDAGKRLDAAGVAALRREALALKGRHYDLAFTWSDREIYCSELVWKAYQRAFGVELGVTQKLREFDLSAPAVKAKLRQRYGDKVPLDETVISPAAIFDSPLLHTVDQS